MIGLKTITLAERVNDFKTAVDTYQQTQDINHALDAAQLGGQVLGSIAVGYLAGKVNWLKYTAGDLLSGNKIGGDLGGDRLGDVINTKKSVAFNKAAGRFLFDATAAEFANRFIDSVNNSGIILDLYDWAREKTTDFFEDIDNAIDDFVDYVEGGIGSIIEQLEQLWDGFEQWIVDVFIDLWIDTGEIANEIFEPVTDFFQDALDWIPRGDPLTLDLDGDGIETIPADGTVLFDHDADGTKTSTGWIQSDDGIVVMDRNNNGVIDNGRELFGDNTIKADGSIAVDGFDALSDLDSNGDGLVDASDTSFSRLRIWRDFNADGISQSNELFTLSQLGIESIGTAGVAANTNVGNDNIAIAEGTFTYSNGQTGTTGVCGFREAA